MATKTTNVSQGDKLLCAVIDIGFWLHELRFLATDPQERASLRFALHRIHDEINESIPKLQALSDELNEEADLMAGDDVPKP